MVWSAVGWPRGESSRCPGRSHARPVVGGAAVRDRAGPGSAFRSRAAGRCAGVHLLGRGHAWLADGAGAPRGSSVSGTVSGKPSGKTVYLQRKTSGKWQSVAHSRLSKSGGYKFSVSPTSAGSWSLRVYKPKGSRKAGYSRTVTVHVVSKTYQLDALLPPSRGGFAKSSAVKPQARRRCRRHLVGSAVAGGLQRFGDAARPLRPPGGRTPVERNVDVDHPVDSGRELELLHIDPVGHQHRDLHVSGDDRRRRERGRRQQRTGHGERACAGPENACRSPSRTPITRAG